MLATGKTATGPVATVAYLTAMPLEFFFFFCYACIGTSVFTSESVKYRHKDKWLNRIKQPESQFHVAFNSKDGARPRDW